MKNSLFSGGFVRSYTFFVYFPVVSLLAVIHAGSPTRMTRRPKRKKCAGDCAKWNAGSRMNGKNGMDRLGHDRADLDAEGQKERKFRIWAFDLIGS